MQLTSIAIFAGLSAIASSWQITVYKDINNCSPTSTQTYRVWSGTGNTDGCQAFGGTAPSGITCSQYEDGGATGPLDCTDITGDDGTEGQFYQGIDMQEDGATIQVYTGDTCDVEFDTLDDHTCYQATGESEYAGFEVSGF